MYLLKFYVCYVGGLDTCMNVQSVLYTSRAPYVYHATSGDREVFGDTSYNVAHHVLCYNMLGLVVELLLSCDGYKTARHG